MDEQPNPGTRRGRLLLLILFFTIYRSSVRYSYYYNYNYYRNNNFELVLYLFAPGLFLILPFYPVQLTLYLLVNRLINTLI